MKRRKAVKRRKAKRRAKTPKPLRAIIVEALRDIRDMLATAERERILHSDRTQLAKCPWGLGSARIEPGASHTFQSIAAGNTKRAYVPERLLLLVDQPGAVVDEFWIGIHDLLSGTKAVPADVFAAVESLVPESMGIVAPMGTPVRLVLRNTRDVPVNACAGLKGHLETDLERADRLEKECRRLSAELERGVSERV
jgi:hypothetical protein